MQGFWPIFFLLVVLKIPVFAGIWLVWWASHQTPDDAYEPSEDSDEGFKRWEPNRPRPRGPHGGPFGGSARPRIRTRQSELAPCGRSQVPLDGHGSSAHTRQAD